jgi:uncharacterized membrane protein
MVAIKASPQVAHDRHHIWTPADLGDKAADAITGFVGSWIFVGIHALWFMLWIVLRIEPFPFGLLTLLVSLEAIFLSTFVMMSQNRSATRDHIRDDHEADEVDMLFKINQTQLEILNLLREVTCPPDEAKSTSARLAAPPATSAIPRTGSDQASTAVTQPKPSPRRRR